MRGKDQRTESGGVSTEMHRKIYTPASSSKNWQLAQGAFRK
jgi:hypothetical protein